MHIILAKVIYAINEHENYSILYGTKTLTLRNLKLSQNQDDDITEIVKSNMSLTAIE